MLSFRMRRRFWVYLTVGTAAATFLVVLLYTTWGLPDQAARLAPFVGYILLTIGWIVTCEVNIGNSRRQHTDHPDHAAHLRPATRRQPRHHQTDLAKFSEQASAEHDYLLR